MNISKEEKKLISALPSDIVKAAINDSSCSHTFYQQPLGLCRTFTFALNQNTFDVCQNCRNHCTCSDITNLVKKSLQSIFHKSLKKVPNICNCLGRTSYYYTDIVTICCNKSDRKQNDQITLFSALVNNIKAKRERLHTFEKRGLSGKQLEVLFNLTLNNIINSMEDIFNVPFKEATHKALESKFKNGEEMSLMDTTKLLDFSTNSMAEAVKKKAKEASKIAKRKAKKAPKIVKKEATEVSEVVMSQKKIKKRGSYCGDGSRRNFTSSDFCGLSCKTNRTVNFFYLDLDRYLKIAEGVGILLQRLRRPIAMALIDVKVSRFVFQLWEGILAQRVWPVFQSTTIKE